ncbi:hypothetical protein PK35_16085 [Tamlana nanhaiensis]|uniref:Putative auto-transporter adhesin head GIN domain-containing protein n=1 Tax=Neotamlana nanhaiensis TaxID=1382798 RepID=A0A0D7VWA4_9FLAO|nr:head GIN domain-containing protein [Tamlana nanhaiensis]KJD31160.1 hypothetical protein PK35_16085 [Tamlana nanhaiensis]
MTTLIKIILAAILSLSLFSCRFDMGVRGNGNVTTSTRPVTETFNTIKATEGLDVYLTQSNNESISVEADENLQNLILTDIEDGVLKIHCKESIGFSTVLKVNVSFTNINSIISTSGSDVYSKNTITVDDLSLKSTSGSDMKLDVNTQTLNCKATSGSDLRLSGKTLKLHAEATSGSDITAADLVAQSSDVKATSGAGITVNTTETLIAKATSGGDVKYYGNPKTVDKSDSSAGSIKQQ